MAGAKLISPVCCASFFLTGSHSPSVLFPLPAALRPSTLPGSPLSVPRTSAVSPSSSVHQKSVLRLFPLPIRAPKSTKSELCTSTPVLPRYGFATPTAIFSFSRLLTINYLLLPFVRPFQAASPDFPPQPGARYSLALCTDVLRFVVETKIGVDDRKLSSSPRTDRE